MNNEVRPIDANALRKKTYPFPCAIGVEHAVPLRAIDEAPTVDAVPVVRCKDCMHLMRMFNCCTAGGGMSPILYNIETFFCAVGKRAETKEETKDV